MEQNKRLNIIKYNIIVALAGGINGMLAFAIFKHANDRTMSLTLYRNDYICLFLCILIFIIMHTVLWAGISIFFIKFFKLSPEKEFKKNTYIFAIPFLLIMALPILVKYYSKLVALNLKVLGAVYMPWGGFIHFNPAGYFLLILFGFIIITILFIFILRFVVQMYYNDFHKPNTAKILLVSTFIFYTLTTTYITFIYPPTADEPHYLIIAQSLINDFDVNLENNYITDKTYRAFYPGELEYQNIHNTHDKNGKGIYSMHSIGLPILIALFYKIGGRVFVQLLMNFFTAVLILVFYLFLKKINVKNELAYLSSMLIALTVPILTNSSLVLTEIPAAIIILYCFYVLYEYKFSDNNFSLLLVFLGIAFLPWLHSKLVLFSVIFYFYYYVNIIRYKDFKLKKEITNNSIIIVSVLLFIYFYYSIYGNFAPFALVSICTSSSFYFIFSLQHAIKAFFAILFDRSYGIFTYNMFYLIILWGIMLFIKQGKIRQLIPFFLILPYFFMFLLWNDWGGSITPMRQMIPILPVASLYAVYFLQESNFIRTRLFKFIVVYSLFISYILMVFPVLRYMSSKEKIYHFFDKYNLLWFLPSFYDNIGLKHFITVIYFIIIIALFFKYVPKEKNEK